MAARIAFPLAWMLCALVGTRCCAADVRKETVIVDSDAALQARAQQFAQNIAAPSATRATFLGQWGLAPVHGATRFTLELSPRHSSTTVSWVDVRARSQPSGEAPSSEAVLRYRVEALQQVFAALVPMRQGDTFSCANFQQQARTLEGQSLDLVWRGDCGRASHWTLRRALQPGDILLQTDVGPAPAVARNRQVQAVVAVGAVTVEAPAIALVDGDQGQQIRIRLLDGHSTLAATVVGVNHVAVDEALP